MTKARAKKADRQNEKTVFALDIGTRSIIGMVGTSQDGKVKILAIEKAEHTNRAMIDGQIENIERVAELAGQVKERLEQKLNLKLDRVCVAAAGRALKTKRADFELELPGTQLIDDEIISRLEAGAISRAEETFEEANAMEGISRRFYLVGYSVCQYYLDNYMMSSLKDHRGQRVKADLIATFLPREVVESLYTTMHKIGLEVASITLEPIAAINAAIPENLRLLNLVMVDIGAGTSDIAACMGGSVTGFTMATLAGDEITETIMKEYLVDFGTAETMKARMDQEDTITFTDILGFEQTVTQTEIRECVKDTSAVLCKEISDKILEVNDKPPSALFLAGGGSKLAGLREGLTDALGMNPNRVAIAGNNFQANAYSDEYDLNNPEYATPLGIAISSGLNLINDSFRVILNGKAAKLFRSGSFTVLNLLMMNGYSFQDIMGRPGLNLVVSVNGKRKVFYGTAAQPASLLINKKEGKLSEIVHAGDCIDFVPAVHGVSSHARLKDVEGAPASLQITLNGKRASLETPLKNGDRIVMLLPETARPAKEMPEKKVSRKETDQAGPGKHGVPGMKLEGGTDTGQDEASGAMRDSAHYPKRGEASGTTPDSASYPMQGEASGTTTKTASHPKPDTASHPNPEATTGLKPPPSPVPIAPPATHKKKRILFHLNNAPLELEPREDGQPYYLMDMLQYSGIDFGHIKGEVILHVNGEPGFFQQPLEEGDFIVIAET